MSGLLLGWIGISQGSSPHWTVLRNAVRLASTIAGWDHLVLRTSQPLDNEQIVGDGVFEYHYLFRVSRHHAILVARQSHLVEALVQHAKLNQNVLPPRVDVLRLVKDISEHPDDRYVIASAYAKVDGFGQSLRTVALWGSDLADASLFQEMRFHLLPYRIELRDPAAATNVLSINSRGEVSFLFDGEYSLRHVIRALKYLSDRRYIDWPT